MSEEASYHLNVYLALSLDFSCWKMGSNPPISIFTALYISTYRNNLF